MYKRQAYDIAGQNVASEESFRQALYAALDIYRNRIRYREATANPLRKQYFDKGGDNEKGVNCQLVIISVVK